MNLEDGLVLYHGSYAPIESIELSKCRTGKDFGKGFYLTTDYSQAKSFIPSSLRKAVAVGEVNAKQDYGYVSAFAFKSSEKSPSFYALPNADKQWLWFIALNRRSALADSLKPKIEPALLSAEIVAGKVADDATNPVITTYLNGLYGPIEDDAAAERAIEMLLPDRLKDQFCFPTERAIEHLSLLEVKRHEF